MEGQLQLWIATIAALSSAIGLIFLGFQTRFQSRLAKAQFLDKLSCDVELNIEIEIELEQAGRLYLEIDTLEPEDRRDIIRFLTFFDRLAHLYELKFVSMAIIDNLFAYRFFILTHNPNVQKFELMADDTKHFWISIFALHKAWYKYRKNKNKKILREEYREGLVNDDVYKASKLG